MILGWVFVHNLKTKKTRATPTAESSTKKKNHNASVYAIIKSCIKKLFTAVGRNEEEVITRPENIYWLAQVEDFL